MIRAVPSVCRRHGWAALSMVATAAALGWFRHLTAVGEGVPIEEIAQEFSSLWDCSSLEEALDRMSVRLGERTGASVTVVPGPGLERAGARTRRTSSTDPVALEVPVRTDGAVVAIVRVHPPVSAEHERVVRVYADFAGVMLTGLRAREDDVARAVVDERSRLAREIHDGMAQQLAFLKMRVAWLKRSPHLVTAEQLGDVEAGLGGALAEARAAITTLRAQPGTAVSEMIANYAEEFAQVAGIAIDVRLSHDHIDLPPRAGVELLRIVQEALNNVRKHAHASRVSVDVEATGDGISVTVRDDGVGLTSDANPRGHFGTQIMAERAESIGGRCHLESTGDGGTSVHVWVPLPTAG